MLEHRANEDFSNRPYRRGLCLTAFVFGLVAVSIVGLIGEVRSAPSVGLRGEPQIHADAGNRLFDRLGNTRTEAEARAIADEIWRHWFLAPEESAADLMAEAMERRGRNDFAGALRILDELVETTPDWAEAWNQRATLRFIIHDYAGSLADIRETLDLEPRHFGALSGKAMILMRLGLVDQAQTILRHALTIHPFLAERRFVIEAPGQDI